MKVAIIGAGDVGAASGQRIAEANLADVVLVDIIPGMAQAKAQDLSSAAPIVRHNRTITGSTDVQDIAKADIVVVTCGQRRKPGQSRDELLQANAKIVQDISLKIAKYCPDSIVIVVSNPLDIMTYLVYKTTKFAARQIIGMGGVSDCARFNMLVAQELNTASGNVQSLIIGPHSDNMVILSRFASVSGIPLAELLRMSKIEKIIAQTKGFGAKIVELLGSASAYYGPSAGVFLIVDSIINDRKNVLCSSVYLTGQYGLKDLCIGVPAKIGRGGVEEIIELELNEREKREFLSSSAAVREMIKKLNEVRT